jgi:hypothetical protein
MPCANLQGWPACVTHWAFSTRSIAVLWNSAGLLRTVILISTVASRFFGRRAGAAPPAHDRCQRHAKMVFVARRRIESPLRRLTSTI